MKKTKIYIVTNCYNDPNKVYIGKTINSRKHNHKKTYGKCINYFYIDEINSLDHKNWKWLESYWIEQFRQWGFEVLNINNGGGGPTQWSGELLNSEGNKNRIKKIKTHPTRAKKISKSTKGIPLTEEHKQKLRGPRPHLVGKKKKPLSQKTRDKISKSLKGRISPRKGTVVGSLQKENIIKANVKPVLQYDINNNFIKEWGSQIEACQYLGINPPSISNCLKGRSKTGGGYKWKYKQ